MTEPRLITDINVLLFGLVGKEGALAHQLVQNFRKRNVILVFDEALADELEQVMNYPAILTRGLTPSLAFRLARDLFALGDYVPQVTRYDWPSLKDSKDWYLLDLLFEAKADGLITQDKALREVGKTLGMPVYNLSEGAAKGWY